MDRANTSADVFADSVYRSAENEAKLKATGFNSRIHRRAGRNRPLSSAQTKANRSKSKIRVRVEHVFGAQEISPGGRLVRTIGIGKTLASFDFDAVPMVSKAQVMALTSGDSWIEKGADLLLFGPPGARKSHLAAAIGLAINMIMPSLPAAASSSDCRRHSHPDCRATDVPTE